MRNPRSVSYLLIGALALAVPASAQNLLVNAEFDLADGLDSWGALVGTWDLTTDSGGCGDSEAAAGSSVLFGSNQYLWFESECHAVNPVATPTLHLGALYRTTAQVFTRLHLHFFSDGACAVEHATDPYSVPPVFAGTSATWRHLLGALPVVTGAGSLRVSIDFNPMVSGLSPFVADLDRIYLGVQPQILLDGFETNGGSTCRWSTASS